MKIIKSDCCCCGFSLFFSPLKFPVFSLRKPLIPTLFFFLVSSKQDFSNIFPASYSLNNTESASFERISVSMYVGKEILCWKIKFLEAFHEEATLALHALQHIEKS